MPGQLVKHYFWVSVRVFLEEISIWFCRLNKDRLHTPILLSIIHLLKAYPIQKVDGMAILFFNLGWDISLLLPLKISIPHSQAFRLGLQLNLGLPWFSVLWTEFYYWLSWFSSLQFLWW